MAVTNLKNYTWVANGQYNSPLSSVGFSIIFVSNNTRYTSIAMGFPNYTINYNTTKVYDSDEGSGWEDDVYKTIYFVGGDDITNTTLINWLETYGTLTYTPVTNLTGYTWNADTRVTAEYADYFRNTTRSLNVNFNSNGQNYTQFNTWDDDGGYTLKIYYDETLVQDANSSPWWTNEAYRTVNFTGGVDATNTNLIDLLEIEGILTPTPITGYDVTFVTNGADPINPLEDVEELPTPLPTPTKANNIFGGWYYDTLFTQRAYAGDELTSNVTLYARWYTSITQLMTGIADAIRSKTSEVGEIEAIDFADKIRWL